MRIDLPFCGFNRCKYHFDGNCIDNKRYDSCDYRYAKEEREALIASQETLQNYMIGLQAENEMLKKELKITRAYLHDSGLEWDLLSYSERIGR